MMLVIIYDRQMFIVQATEWEIGLTCKWALSRVSIGEVCWQNCWQYGTVSMQPLLAFASLGYTTEIEMYLFVLLTKVTKASKVFVTVLDSYEKNFQCIWTSNS
jgi:hypothetical protein